MGRAVEAILAHLQARVVVIGHGVHVGVGRHGLVEGRVEHRDVGGIGHHLLAGLDALDVGGVVQRPEDDVVVDGLHDLGVDDLALGEGRAAVQHAVADRVDLLHVGDDALLLVGQGLDDVLHGLGVVLERRIEHDFPLGGRLLDVAALDADALGLALGDDALVVHVDELVLDGGRTRVDDEDLHVLSPSFFPKIRGRGAEFFRPSPQMFYFLSFFTSAGPARRSARTGRRCRPPSSRGTGR